MRKLVFAVLLLFSVGCPAYTGKHVLDTCLEITKAGPTIGAIYEGPWCLGYIGGLHDMAVLHAWLSKNPFYCLPKKEGSVSGLVIRFYLRWLETHPADLHKSARSLFLTAMKDAFPCK